MRENDRARPSRPPGATQTPNQGVGMGEGEKVAQDGDTEAREGIQERVLASLGARAGRLEEVQTAAWNRLDQASSERRVLREGLASMVRRIHDVDRRLGTAGRRITALEQDIEALRSRVVRNEELEEAREKKPSPLGLYSDTIFLESDHPETIGFDPAFSLDFTATTPALVFCDPHDYCGPYPCPSCPPAPPPSAEPAAPTSSGREGSTAGDAVSCCCEPMKNWVSIWGPLEVVGSDVEGIGPPKFCLWCASPLREDGELRVGVQPVEGRDTCEKGEEGGGG